MTEKSINTDVLVVGATSTGLKVAEEIKSFSYNVEVLDTPLKLQNLKGFAGDFTATIDGVDKKFGAVVAATDFSIKPLFGFYGLNPSEKIVSLSDYEKMVKNNSLNGAKNVAFLVGFGQEGNPLLMERVFTSILATDQKETKSYVFVNNLKVASKGLEKLYKEGRDKGAIYFKVQEKPEIESDGSRISYIDQVMRTPMEICPDMIVVEEAYTPSDFNMDLAEVMNIKLAKDNLLQMDNVHRYPVDTSKKGIFAAGTARDLMNNVKIDTDAKAVAVNVKELLGEGTVVLPESYAVVDGEKCAICLTCYRCCPHGAINWLPDEAVIDPFACMGCGNCASECPQEAIQLKNYEDASMEEKIEECFKDTKSPVIGFFCKNSAWEALSMAQDFGYEIPENFKAVKVPCAGKVDEDYILRSFAKGAKGVIVLACHPGNCKSEHGNIYAGWRVKDVKAKLETIGIDPEKVMFTTIASNMGSIVKSKIEDFLSKV